MKSNITHITQLTREDLREIAAAANPKPGFMIRIGNTTDGIKIEVDENAFKNAIYGFLRNIGAAIPYRTRDEISNTSCVPEQ